MGSSFLNVERSFEARVYDGNSDKGYIYMCPNDISDRPRDEKASNHMRKRILPSVKDMSLTLKQSFLPDFKEKTRCTRTLHPDPTNSSLVIKTVGS